MRKIAYSDYYRKVEGCWLGKSIGGTMGAHYECQKRIMEFTSPEEYAPSEALSNDDLDWQFLWLHTLLEEGLGLTSKVLLETHFDRYRSGVNEYGFANRNLHRGIYPPYSGSYANEFFKRSMGAPIRAEIWGAVSPGNAELAAHYAEMDGCTDHVEDGVWAEQYTAALTAEAFFEGDVQRLIAKGLEFVPGESRLGRGIRDCMRYYDRGLTWREAMGEIYNEYCHPDPSDAAYNYCVEALALLYGGHDFEKTVTHALNGGWDTDCTCATVGAILGAIHGKTVIPEKWLSRLGRKLESGFSTLREEFSTIDGFTAMTCAAGIALVEEGRSSVRIEGAPERGVRLPAAESKRIEVRVDYRGLPEISPARPAEVALSVENNTDRAHTAEVVFALPEGFAVEGKTAGISLPAGGTVELEYTLSLRDDPALVYDRNIVGVSLQAGGEKLAEADFGLVGAPAWRIIGPFMEQLDRSNRDSNEELPEGVDALHSENMGFFVYLDREYIEERFGPEAFERHWREGRPFCGQQDFVNISDMYGLQGPCCVYALQKLYLPEEEPATPRPLVQFESEERPFDPEGETVELAIGSTDPVKIWLNGELIFTQTENKGWTCHNDRRMIRLKRGMNHVVLKILRKGDHQRLSLLYRDEHSWQNMGLYRTDLGYGV